MESSGAQGASRGWTLTLRPTTGPGRAERAAAVRASAAAALAAAGSRARAPLAASDLFIPSALGRRGSGGERGGDTWGGQEQADSEEEALIEVTVCLCVVLCGGIVCAPMYLHFLPLKVCACIYCGGCAHVCLPSVS